MNRRRAVSSTIAVVGVLVSMTVAGVAVVNASDSDVTTESKTLVVASESLPVPSLEAQPLPQVSLAPMSVNGSPSATSEDESSAAAGTPSVISRREARSLILAQAPGTVVTTWSTVRNGYRAYAVKVLRSDGSLTTGYVDRASGVIFDWTVVAAPASTPSYADDEDDDSSYADHNDDEGQYGDDGASHDESHDEDDD